MELNQQEKEFLQKVMYNEMLKYRYMVNIGAITEMPQELMSIIEKLMEKEEVDGQTNI